MLPKIGRIIQSIRSWLRKHVPFMPIYGSDYGLRLYLPFEEGTGTIAYDQSPYGYDGTISGATVADGKFGKARSFDGVDNYVECPTFNLQDFTFELWIYRDMDSGGYERLISRSGATTYDFWLQIKNTDILQFGFIDGTAGTNQLEGVTPIPTGQWIHLVVVFKKDDKFYIYINGRLDASGVTDGDATEYPTASAYTWQIGRLRAAGIWYYAFDGKIDEVRIYNRALTAEEIRTHYLRGRGVYSRSVTVSDKFRVLGSDLAVDFKIVDGEVTIKDLEGNAGWYVKVDANGKLYIEVA